MAGTREQGRPEHEGRRSAAHQDAERKIPAGCEINLQPDIGERAPVKNPHREQVREDSSEVQPDCGRHHRTEHLERDIYGESADNHQGDKERYPDYHTKARILYFRLGNGWITVGHRNSRQLVHELTAYTYTVL